MNCNQRERGSWTKLAVWMIGLIGLISTGCQVEMGGQTLPSPYYLSDDVQYYAPGPEFKLAREAAAMKEQAESVDEDFEF